MTPLNFSRDLLEGFRRGPRRPFVVPGSPILQDGPELNEFLRGLAVAQKFVLPHGGRLIDDREYRGLDESLPLSLPFHTIALEYRSSVDERGAAVSAGRMPTAKRIVLVHQAPEPCEWLYFWPAFQVHGTPGWFIQKYAQLPRVGAVARDVQRINGRVPLRIALPKVTALSPDDWIDEGIAIVSTLNALACSNVSVGRLAPTRTKPFREREKDAFPFDSYHFLQVECAKESTTESGLRGEHRSPREHLRRGHIRRLNDGRKIWVNAALVNAGVGGVVVKDYGLRASAMEAA